MGVFVHNIPAETALPLSNSRFECGYLPQLRRPKHLSENIRVFGLIKKQKALHKPSYTEPY